jgi:hypothetical protein
MIKKSGSEYIVTDESGEKVLGRHKTHHDAVRQLAAIEASKARRAKGKGSG